VDSGINMNKKFVINGKEKEVQNFQQTQNQVSFVLEGVPYSFSLISSAGFEMTLETKSERFKCALASPNKDGEFMAIAQGAEANISVGDKKRKKNSSHAGGLTSPMPGKIFKILKVPGAEVKKGEVILILEAMKMEHSIRADRDGRVKEIFYQVGELVQGGVALAEMESLG
jgi:biotin carboxyl carrier protein